MNTYRKEWIVPFNLNGKRVPVSFIKDDEKVPSLKVEVDRIPYGIIACNEQGTWEWMIEISIPILHDEIEQILSDLVHDRIIE